MKLMTQNLVPAEWSLSNGMFSIRAKSGPALAMQNISGNIILDGECFSLTDAIPANDYVRDPAAAAHEELLFSNGVRWIRKAFQDGDSVVMQNVLRNDSEKEISLGTWNLLCGTRETGLQVETGIKPEDARVFIWQPWDMQISDLTGENRDFRMTTLLHLSDSRSKQTLMIGFITLDRMSCNISFHTGSETEGITQVYLSCEVGNFKLKPGKEISAETIRAAYYKDPYEALTSWADEMYDFYKPDFTGTQRVILGKGIWRDAFTSPTLTVEKCLRSCEKMLEGPLKGFGVHTLYGSPHAVFKGGLPGNWMTFEKADSGSYEDIYREMNAKGIDFKFWFSPFWFFSEAEETLEENRANLLKWEDGTPVEYAFHNGWELGRGRYGHDVLHKVFLDGTDPRTKAYLQKVFSFYRSMGIRGFMLDFLSVIPGTKYYDDNKLPIEASRSIFTAIREALGRESHLQTAVASSPSYIGCVNSARVVRDFGEGRPQYPLPNWQNSSYCMHDYHFSNLESFMQNIAANWFTNGKIFINDLNELTIDKPVPLNFAQCATTLYGLNGDSPLGIGDDLNMIDPERLRMYKLLLPRTDGNTIPVDLFDRTTSAGGCHILKKPVHTAYDDYMLCAVFNTQVNAKVYSERISFARLGLDASKEYCVYEFWNDEYIGIFRNSFPVELTQNGCKLFRICEHRNYPWLIGSDMTIEQGRTEIEDLVWDAENLTLTAKVTRPVGERGRLIFLMPIWLRVLNHDRVNTMRETIDHQTIASAGVEFHSEHETVVVQFARMDTDKISRPGWLEYTTLEEWKKFRTENPYPDPDRVLW